MALGQHINFSPDFAIFDLVHKLACGNDTPRSVQNTDQPFIKADLTQGITAHHRLKGEHCLVVLNRFFHRIERAQTPLCNGKVEGGKRSAITLAHFAFVHTFHGKVLCLVYLVA